MDPNPTSRPARKMTRHQRKVLLAWLRDQRNKRQQAIDAMQQRINSLEYALNDAISCFDGGTHYVNEERLEAWRDAL